MELKKSWGKNWETEGWLEFLVSVVGIGALAIILAIVLCMITAIPTYFLWNWLMPEIFGLKLITFWQAMGMNFLTMILFKNNAVFKKNN